MNRFLTILSGIRQKYRMFIRDLRLTNTFRCDKETLLSSLLVDGHVLEKGITMPERRNGFGYDKVRQLIAKCSECIKLGGAEMELQSAIADLKQYIEVQERGFKLPEDITSGIQSLIPYLIINDDNCFSTNPKDFFRPVADYKEFAQQRKSVRNFSNEEVEDSILMEAVKLAQTAPSACNRQSVRVKVIENRELMKIIGTEIQNGNRGFGHLANKWLLVTSELGAWSQSQVSMAYIDGGIFTMSLLNALHYYGICACTLNAHLSSSRLTKLQTILNLPKSEVPIVFIVIGKPANKFMIAKSRRKPVEDIVTIIK